MKNNLITRGTGYMGKDVEDLNREEMIECINHCFDIIYSLEMRIHNDYVEKMHDMDNMIKLKFY